ncbi:MAG: hypothetical protein R3349_04430, partial [Geminicoccaceae bacterium]|nr:hypothetical protein [Geminicoccaceae bacterium]
MSDTKIVKQRTAGGARRPPGRWIQSGDLGLMVKLPATALIAALLPPSRWERAAGGLDRLAGWLGARNATIAPHEIAALIQGQGVAAHPSAIYHGLRRNLRLNQLYFVTSWLPRGWSPDLTVRGVEHLHTALAAGKGAVLWVAPFVFAPLVAKRALHEAGFAVHHLSRPGHGFSSTRFGVAVLNPIRTRIEDRYLAERITIPASGETTAAVRKLRARLADNRPVSITFTSQGGRQVEAPFLAGRLRTAIGAST